MAFKFKKKKPLKSKGKPKKKKAPKYSHAEKKAYYMGKGYEFAGSIEGVSTKNNLKTLEERLSFRAGEKAAKKEMDVAADKRFGKGNWKLVMRDDHDVFHRQPLSKDFYEKEQREREKMYDHSKDFDFDERGRIKGGYTRDGFFEPD